MHSAQSQIRLHIRILRISLEKRIPKTIEALFLIWINHEDIENVDPRVILVVPVRSSRKVTITNCQIQ